MPPRRRRQPRSPDHQALGRAVEELRREAGLTQEELADRIQSDTTSLGLIERGLSNPTYTSLVRLARGLDISLDDLAERIERNRRSNPKGESR
jgi:transcriptional regulator with XRE-family HTH domain